VARHFHLDGTAHNRVIAANRGHLAQQVERFVLGPE
jgi:hypothetical protein